METFDAREQFFVNERSQRRLLGSKILHSTATYDSSETCSLFLLIF